MTEQSAGKFKEHVADFFEQVAWKHLRMVDLPGLRSNQHEIGAVAKLRQLLGEKKQEGLRTRWRIFDEEGTLVETILYHDLTWYDCREQQKHRSAEWRLYYPAGETPLEEARVGDFLLISQPGPHLPADDFDLLFYVIPQESSLHNEVLWALGVESVSEQIRTASTEELRARDVPVLQREVLQTLEPDLRLSTPSRSLAARITQEFSDFLESPLKRTFPSTRALAEFAHMNAVVDPSTDPDHALIELLDVESRAFYVLERAMLEKRLEIGFSSVDDFISFSLSVQNRRKARRGRSLENHLAYIFRETGLRFEEQVKTEHSTADFLFPGKKEYLSYSERGEPPVMMLAAKSSCKDRWRQVLNETLALDRRYLFTLEAAISSNQTAEMGDAELTLVVPRDIISSFDDPGTELLDLSEFIARAALLS